MALRTMLSWLTTVVASVGLASTVVLGSCLTISPLSPNQVSYYASFTHFAAAVFCDPSQILSWSSGAHCEANSSFELYSTLEEMESKIQYWFCGLRPGPTTRPILPRRFLGYPHQSGEIHIEDSGVWDACPGQDNPSALCIVGAVRSLFSGQPRDHDGPFEGISMPCNPKKCTGSMMTSTVLITLPGGRECQCTDEVCRKGWARANGKGAHKYEGETGVDITATGWHG